MPERLDETHHRKHFRVCPLLASGRHHFWPCDTLEDGIRMPFADCPDQTRAEQVARGLASDQSDAQGHRIYRMMPRSEERSDSRKMTSSG